MVEIKSMDAIKEKYTRVTPGRAADYQNGINNPKKDWETEAKKSEPNYEAGVQAAISNKSYGKGVSEAGSGKWKEKSLKVGVSRWGPGVTAGADDYAKGFAPFQSVIAGLNLPERKEKGNPANYNRVSAVGEALHKAKMKG